MRDKKLGEKIKTARNKLGLSQAELAKRLGTSQQTIDRWEKGARPKEENLLILSEILGISLDLEPEGRALCRPLANLPLYKLTPKAFQLFCRDLLIEQGHKDAQEYGVSGDKQDGVDVISNDEAQIAIQCKRVKSFGPQATQKAIDLYIAHGRSDKEKIIALTKEHTRAEQDAAQDNGWKIWDISDLTKKVRDLDEQSQRRLMRTYFPGESSVLENCLGLKATSLFMDGDEFFEQYGDGQFLDYNLPYRGDTEMLEKILIALDDNEKTAIVISGDGGMGKTRLLKEIYQQAKKQVLFLRENAQLKADDLIELQNKGAIIVIDDAHRRQDELRACLSLVGNNNKLVATTRPYGLDAVKTILSQKDLIDPNTVFKIKKLDLGSARQLVCDIAGETRLNEQLVSITRDNTLLLTLGARALRESKILPQQLLGMDSIQDKIEGFMKECVGGIAISSRELAQDILDVASVVQPFTNDQRFKKVMRELSNTQKDRSINRCIAELSKAGLLYEYDNRWRIKPDLMGDYTLEQLLSTSTGFIEDIISCSGDTYFENILQNLCQLDWRTSQKKIARNQLDSLWGKLKERFFGTTDADGRYEVIQLVEKVAYYQPKCALTFVDLAIKNIEPTVYTEWFDKKTIIKAIVAVLESLAYIEEYLPDVVKRLTCLADTYPDIGYGHNDDSPVKSLQAIASPKRSKPGWYMKTVVDYMLDYLFEDQHSFSPFDVLDASLETQVNDTIPISNVSFEMYACRLRPEHTASYRPQIVQKILSCLTSNNLTLATRAARSLKVVFNVSEPQYWKDDLKNVLYTLEDLIKKEKRNIDPTVLAQIYISINWLPSKSGIYDGATLVEVAKRITQEVIPKTLDFEIALAMIDQDGYIIFAHESEDYQACQQSYRSWLKDLAARLFRGSSMDYDAVLDKILDAQKKISQSFDRNAAYACRPLIAACCEESEDFCEALGNHILAKYFDPSLVYYCLFSIHKTFKNDAAAKQLIERMLKSGDEDLVKSAIGNLSACYDMFTKAELENIYNEQVRSNSKLTSVVFQSLAWLPLEYEDLVLEVINGLISKALEKDVVESLVEAISDAEHRGMRLLHSIDRQALFKRLVWLDSLDEYKSHCILQRLCNEETKAVKGVLQLLFDRIDFWCHLDDEKARFNYDVIPFMTHLDIPKSSYEEIISLLCKKIADKNMPYESFYVVRILKYLNIDQDYLAETAIKMLSESPHTKSIETALVLIKSIPAGLVYRHDEVEQLLNAAKRWGDETVEAMSDAIFSTIFNAGASSRTIGEPGSTEIKLRDDATEALQGVLVGSPVSRLYQKILRYAADELDRQAQRDKELLEEL